MKFFLSNFMLLGATTLLLTGCGDDTVIETGTYTCKNTVNGEKIELIFDMEKRTFDMVKNDKPFTKTLPHGLSVVISEQNEKTKEYTVTVGGAMPLWISKKADKFSLNFGKNRKDEVICKKK